MQLEDGLLTMFPGVNYDPITIFINAQITSELAAHIEQMSCGTAVVFCHFSQTRQGLFRNDEAMDRGCRSDILNGDAVLILVDYLSWYLSPDDLMENGVFFQATPLIYSTFLCYLPIISNGRS